MTQILTSTDDSRTERVKKYRPCTHNRGIQMIRKAVTKTFKMNLKGQNPFGLHGLHIHISVL